jgi:tetratricopeptide (TPR) repeat protein
MFILKKILFNLVLPFVIIVWAVNYNIFLGVLAVLAYIAYIAYSSRMSIFTRIGGKKYTDGDIKGATVWYEKAYNTGKARVNIIVSYAYLLLKSGNIEKPEKIYKELLGKNNTIDEEMLIKSNIALVLWKKGELNQAVDMLEEVVKTYKTSAVYGSLGFLLLLKEDFDRALELNLEAYNYNDSNTVIRDNLGQTYYFRGEFDKAQEIYEKLIPESPTFPEAYFNYGLLLVKKGETEKAVENMKKSLNFKFTFLSGVTREEIEAKIEEVSKATNINQDKN